MATVRYYFPTFLVDFPPIACDSTAMQARSSPVEALLVRRVRAGIKARDVAKAIGVGPSVFSKWEKGREAVPVKRLAAWKVALGKMEAKR